MLLDHFFDLNNKLLKDNKLNSFGFVYAIEFDKIYFDEENNQPFSI